MTIADSILRPRVPRVGTITTGRGVAATSKQGRDYARPTRESTLVVHTDDPELATAVQNAYGGSVHQDSPTWAYDVVTDTTTLQCALLPSLFRQSLESWRAGQCARRCDGVTTATLDGRPSVTPCVCQAELDAGADERACSPHTIMPVLLDLDVARVGTWEVRSTSWGTAANLAGTLRLLQSTGYTGEVPAVLSVSQRTLRDRTNTVREVPELTVVPAVSLHQLASGRVAALPGQELPELDAPEDRVLAALQDSWETLWARAGRLGLTVKGAAAHAWWQAHHAGTHWQDLSAADLRVAVDALAGMIEDADPVPEPSTTPEDAAQSSEAVGVGEAPPEPAATQDAPVADAREAVEPCEGCGATAPAEADAGCTVCMGWGPTSADPAPADDTPV